MNMFCQEKTKMELKFNLYHYDVTDVDVFYKNLFYNTETTSETERTFRNVEKSWKLLNF